VLVVHRSERSDLLVDALGDILTEPLEDEMAVEVVAVPTRGVERWLTQKLSHRLGTGPGGEAGVCANVAFPFPGALVGEATAAACGMDGGTDPWVPERMVWPLLEVIDSRLDDPFLSVLRRHLHGGRPADGGQVRRFATARHLADLFDHYGVHRPEMVRGWLAGTGEYSHTWQAELWRLLRHRIGVESPPERLDRTVERLRSEPGLLHLPDRVSVFGLTRLPASYLAVLGAMACRRQVHLFLLHPSAPLWDNIAGRCPAPPLPMRRRDDPTVRLPRNPLLRSWAGDAREMQLILAAHGAVTAAHRPVADAPQATLLRRIQDDIRADRGPGGGTGDGYRPPLLLDAGDRSVQVHSCHGRPRQVEVIRDAVLHLLASDTTLEPRHVIVMCPDIEHFAPLIQATFGTTPATGQGDGDGGHVPGYPGSTLRVRLADRSLRQTNPLLAVAAQLVELSSSRVTASELLDLAGQPPVRRRFHFDDDDLAQLERWAVESGIHWGLDAGHRRAWGLEGVDANTWAFGLRRLLLGVAMADEGERLFGGVVPVDDVTSNQVDLAGRLAELVSRVRLAVDVLSRRQTVVGWAAALADATRSLATVSPADSWQAAQLSRVLEEVVDEAGAGEPPDGSQAATELDLSEVRTLLDRRLQGRPTRANFRTGDLTFCTLVPMRSVPHRVVCLLGLDDGAFPRQPARDGDDLLLAEPMVGDRDPRREDQQLLLDAVLAATDHLVITFAGRDERINRRRPPAVPVSELLDVVDRCARRSDGRPARHSVVVEHPLQPFDPRNFSPGGLVAGRRWSYDPLYLDGARSAAGRRQRPGKFVGEPLPPVRLAAMTLDALVAFVEQPVNAFLRQRLGARIGGAGTEIDDSLPVELDGLQQWTVGDRMLNACLEHGDLERARRAEAVRGQVPWDRLGERALGRIGDQVSALVAAVGDLGGAAAPAESEEVNLEFDNGCRLVGTVPGVRAGTIVRCTYSTLAPKHRLRAWVQFLALTAARPGLEVAAVTVGRAGGPGASGLVCVSRLAPLEGEPGARADAARRLLAAVVDLYRRGMSEPLPLYCKTSAAWAEAARRGDDAAAHARWQWETRGQYRQEDSEPAHLMVLGGRVPFDTLLQQPPAHGESGPGWAADETTRLGRLARRLWDPIPSHESSTVQ
jgi:exodeoxyribonuclease V gamma subunit